MKFQNINTFFSQKLFVFAISTHKNHGCFNCGNDIIIIISICVYQTDAEREYLSQRRYSVRFISIYRHIHQLSSI
jgi:hypothetical protein